MKEQTVYQKVAIEFHYIKETVQELARYALLTVPLRSLTNAIVVATSTLFFTLSASFLRRCRLPSYPNSFVETTTMQSQTFHLCKRQ